MMSERTKAGMEAARANGVKLGRKRKLTKEDVRGILAMKAQRHSHAAIAASFDISMRTLSRTLNEYHPQPERIPTDVRIT